ncbi:MAG: biotin-dependent carboxyltransferase family protein [Chloroflexi bacterium]|nr:biotin-dependent carboxyltransferase family protein [Chloroflexota bacterium]
MKAIEIVEPGLLATVQDLGRYGYQRYGVPVSGSMDQFALRAANLLVGNDEGAAGLEITLIGPRLRFLANAVIAVAGADLAPMLDGQPLPMWQSHEVSRGSTLSFAGIRDGVRSYLSIAGGIDVPVVLGSRSTFTRARIGGFDGRALAQGDTLSIPEGVSTDLGRTRRMPPSRVPVYGHSHNVRVVLGPQDDAFTPRGMETFLSATYTVTPQSDRVGYRLEGLRIEHVAGADIVSDGIPFGAVQVVGDGMPIILMADRGSTGGYTKIAAVISADLPSLAQAAPGDTVAFQSVTVEEAHRVLREQEQLLREIAPGDAA